jgi:MoaA/NifB/PqqE/SkfB family radical SAM enzyme
MKRGCQSSRFTKNTCTKPFLTIAIDSLTNCFLCDCEGWLPIPVGKVLDFWSIEEVFSCSSAKILQEDISQGHFSWCAVEHCGILENAIDPRNFSLSINIDESCNLHCPSCRRDPIMITQGEAYDLKIKSIERILHWLELFDKKIQISMSGSGDPLASLITRPLIKTQKLKPNQIFSLGTNGLLIKKQLQGQPIFDNIRRFNISVDAGSADVYHDVRRPGKWEILIENLEFLRDSGKSSITNLQFIVQNKNYKDLPAFVDLCKSFGFTGAVTQLDDWGTWNVNDTPIKDFWTIKNGVFHDHDVLNVSHKNHADAKSIIKQCLGDPIIMFSPVILKKIQQ